MISSEEPVLRAPMQPQPEHLWRRAKPGSGEISGTGGTLNPPNIDLLNRITSMYPEVILDAPSLAGFTEFSGTIVRNNFDNWSDVASRALV